MGTPLFAPEVAAKRDIRAVDGLHQSVSRRFGVGRRLLGSWPETGLEEIDCDLPEEDFWPD
jgi:nucleotide-binding universal stress UspA family protein